MSDTELLNFVEEHGIQIWAQRKSKHGPVAHWWVQNPAPWFQTYAPTLRKALEQLIAKIPNDD